jgi:2-phosphoglycerate kinase
VIHPDTELKVELLDGSRQRLAGLLKGSSMSYPPRSWEVLLVGGPSGTGKTQVSYPVARHFGVGITEVDDFQVMLERMTTPEQQPELHYWNTHPEAPSLPAEQILDHLLAIGRVMTPALEAVIANHLESNAPVVLEGDFILPELAARTQFMDEPNNGRVRAVFLYEPDEAQLSRNYALREPSAGLQNKRARVSWLYGQWLKTETERFGIPLLPARPWDTVFKRVLETITAPA